MKTQLQTIRNGLNLLFLFSVTALLGISRSNAQVNYDMTPITGSYTQIPGGTVINTNAGLTAGVMTGDQDDGAAIVTLPFTFRYNGNAFTQITFCTNGWLGLGNQGTITAAQGRAPGSLFTTTVPNNVISPWWRDMGANFPLGSGAMVHGLVGTDVYAFEWRNACGVGFTDNASSVLINFKVLLYGPASSNPGRIEMVYGPATGGTPTTATSVGLEDAVGGTGKFINALNGSTSSTTTSTVWPATGSGYRFDTLATCAGAPSAQPTALTFPTPASTQLTASFTHAAPQPSKYLVVRYPSGASPVAPVNGTSYSVGSTLGTGTVIGASNATSYTSTGLTPSTTYDFYVYSYSVCLTGPLYNVTSPLFASQATIAPVGVITTATGGLWSQTTTWAAGILPSPYDTVIVASGATLTVDIAATAGKVQLNSNSTIFLNSTLVDSTDLVIGTGAAFNSYFGTTGRQLTVRGNITNSGSLNMNMPSSILLLNGITAQTISGTGTFTLIPTLTVNNLAGVVMNTNLTVSNALNLTNGIVSGSGTLTQGNLSFNPSYAMTSTGGRLSCTSVSGLTGMVPGNATFTYSAPTPVGSITTGNELAISAPGIMTAVFNAISPGNYTLGTNISVFNATISDTVDVGSNTMTVNGNATFNATANVTGAGTYTQVANSTLTTANLAGITAVATSGSVRTATRNYNAAANYNFNGAAGQVTGDGLPTTLTGGTVSINTTSGTALSQSTQFYNLTLGANLLTAGFDATVSNIANLGTSQVSGTGGFITTSSARLLLNNTNASGVIQNTPATNGNIINTGTRTFATGTDIVIGGSAVATGNGFPTTGVDSLVLNQTTTVVLSGATSVNTLYITNTGRMTTTAVNTLTVLGTTAGSVARNSTGYIDGPLTRTMGVGNSGAYIFPLGVGATGGLGMEIINPVVTGSSVTVTAVVRNLSAAGTAGTGLTAVATNRYWAIAPVFGGTLSSIKNIRIYETTTSGLGTSKKIGMTTSSASGTYNTIGGQVDSGAINILSSMTIPSLSVVDSSFFVLGAGSASGSFTGGTITVGPTGTYFSLTGAIAAINEAATLSSSVILELQPTYNPSVESFPIVLRATLPTTTSKTITIRPAAAVSGVINFNGASALSTALFDFNGGSNIIIDGRPGGTGTNRYIAINQQSIGTFPSVRFINDAQNDTLRYVVVSGQNTSTTSGLIVFSTGVVSGNSNIQIDNATINGMSNTANCIFASGSTAPADNKNVVISNSNIYDFFVNSLSCIGILVNGGNSNWTINANNFYQTAARNSFSIPAMTSATQFRAMNLNSSATNAVWTVTNNKIGGSISGVPGSVFVIGDSSSALAHMIRPIDISNAGTSAPTSVQGNTISNITLFTSGTDHFTGIGVLQAGIYNVGNITPNTVGSTTTNGSIAIYNRSTSAIIADGFRWSGTGGGLFQNNIVSGIDATVQGAQAAGGTNTFRGITVGGVTFLGTTNTLTLSGNTFGSTTLANSFRGLSSSVGAVGFYGMFVNGATGAAVTVSNNTVSNLTSFVQAFSTSSSVRGINITGASSISTTVSGNTITNLRCDAPNNAADVNTVVVGIHNNTNGTGTQVISNNTINSLISTYNGPVANVATGIVYISSNTSGTSRIDRNVIHSIETGSSNAFASQLGMFLASGATYVQVQNNFIRLGVNVNGTTNNTNASLYGFYKQTTNNTSLINNSVYLGGSPANTDSLSISAALYRIGGGPVDTIMNNIFMNARSRTSGIGEFYAMYLASTTGMVADANLCFANGTGGVPFRVGTTRYTTMQAWRAVQKPWSQKSANANPLFNAGITNSAATINFTLQAASPAARAGVPLTHITVDQGGNTRTATPSIGAYDVGLSALTAANDVYSPVFSFTKGGNRASSNTTFSNVTVTDIGMGVPTSGATAPKLWYKNATTNSVWASVAPTSNTGTANAAVFSYTFVWASIGGTPAINDKIYYYFVAQDAATTPNIWYSQYSATDPIHSSVSAQTTAPSQADSFLIVTPLATTITIPGTYPTLTGVGGFFAAVNSAALGGNTTVTITADVNETGVNELKPDGLSGFNLLIQPDASLRTLWGNSTSSLIRLNGVSKVTFDGGVNRNLQIIDSIGGTSSGTVGAAIEFFGGCSNDTLVNCVIAGNSSNSGKGTVLLGTGSNSNLVIANCDIKGLDSLNVPANGIFSNNLNNSNIIIGGTTARPGGNIIHDFSVSGINLASIGNNTMIGNLTVAANGNQLYNRSSGTTITYVSIGSSDNHTIANNKVYQKTGSYSSTVVGYSLTGGGNGHRITRNHFGGNAADRSGVALISTGSNVTGINASVGVTSNTVIDSNYVSNFGNSGSSGVFGIALSSGNASIQKNIVGFGINAYDTIQNRFDNGLVNITGGNIVLIEDNKIGNAKYVRNAGDRTSGITITGTLLALTIRNNIVKDIISDATSTTTSSFGSKGIIIAGTNNGAIIEGNTVYNINNNNVGTAAYVISGISTTSPLTNSIIRNNRIYNIGAIGLGTGTSAPTAYGIYFANTGSFGNTVINNQISVGVGAGNEIIVQGIRDEASSGTNSYINNSVFINGSIASGANASHGIFRSSTVNMVTTNNLIYNKRSGGTGKNYALGSASITGVGGANIQYNMMFVNDTAVLAELPTGIANGWAGLGTFYTTTYNTNWAEKTATVSPELLFIDTLVGNLGIVTTNPASWYVNGKGIRVIGQTGDFANASGVRSGSIATGAVDIGSVEFTTSTTPPDAYADKTPAVTDSTQFFFASRMVAKMVWGATGVLPATVTAKYYSGVNPSNVAAGKTTMNAYWNLTQTGGSGYSYALTLMQDSAVLGTVTAVGNLGIARYTGTGTVWNLFATSGVNNVTGFMSSANRTAVGIYTGTDVAVNPVPVKYVAFTASTDAKDVILDWNTASEINNNGFEIERSVDGKQFEYVNLVKGAGNSADVHAYSYTDADAFTVAKNNTLYYRLKQVDFDGQFTYSNTVKVSKDADESGVTVYPNPYNSDVTVSFRATEGKASVEVIDIRGRVVMTETLATKAGMNRIMISKASELQSGIYFARIQVNGQTTMVKLVKN
jgi:hypothetical protein